MFAVRLLCCCATEYVVFLLPGAAVRRMALRMAGLLTPLPPLPPPPEPADDVDRGVAAALAAVSEARALAIIAASALALCAALGTGALPVPTDAVGAVELDGGEEEVEAGYADPTPTPPSAKPD